MQPGRRMISDTERAFPSESDAGSRKLCMLRGSFSFGGVCDKIIISKRLLCFLLLIVAGLI